MVTIAALWLPIVLSAVLVFMASALAHMVLPYHRSDYDRLSDEDSVLDALRDQKAGAGNYVAPHCVTPQERKSPEIMAKMKRGPLAFVTVIPSLAMGKQLISWFVFCIVAGVLTAYVASFTLSAGDAYMVVFRLVGTVAFFVYAGCAPTESIWMGRKWSSSIKHVFDGLIYGLLTAGCFGWLWPS